MSRLMVGLRKISESLDSKKIGEVLLALQSLDDDVEFEESSFSAFLHEIITWDLSESPNIAESVIRQMMSYLKTPEVIQGICVEILKAQTDLAVQIAVEAMIGEKLKLSHEDCREVWKSIEFKKTTEVINESRIEEFLTRSAANSRILRISGTPERFILKILEYGITQAKSKIPREFLDELLHVAPFHPLLIMEDFKNPHFWIPRVISEEHRFRLEIDEFLKYSPHFQKENSRELLRIFWGICERMERIETLDSDEIERIVDFWIAGIGIFDGYGIGMEDIQEAAKWIERTTERFLEKRQPLFLKRFLRKLAEKKDASSMEPQIVATIITTFQRITFRIRSPEIYDELGDFWTLCFRMKYDDVYYSTVFYSSVFALAQAQAVFKVKKELCRAVYEKILKPMHQQIVDFVKLKRVEENKATTEEEKLVLEEKNLGASYFSILTCTYKNAEERILEFINS